MRVFVVVLIIVLSNSCNDRPSCPVETISKVPISDHGKDDEPSTNENGVIFFSFDNGGSWENKSIGLPEGIFLTDIATSDGLIGISTKQNGIFFYNFQANIWRSGANNPPTPNNLDALIFFNDQLLVGAENAGIFISDIQGQSWRPYNKGLEDLTIRKFAVVNNKLFVGTNSGLYSLNEKEKEWILEYGESTLQVNGITGLDGEIYIGTNHGLFKTSNGQKSWKNVMPNRSLHNISSDENTVYAMVYDELYTSTDQGNTWKSIQKGLPDQLYSFQVIKKDSVIMVGQWDGVYKKKGSDIFPFATNEWEFSSRGLPSKFAVTEMKTYKNMLVIGTTR